MPESDEIWLNRFINDEKKIGNKVFPETKGRYNPFQTARLYVNVLVDLLLKSMEIEEVSKNLRDAYKINKWNINKVTLDIPKSKENEYKQAVKLFRKYLPEKENDI